jgi:hypothetical protein
VHEQFLLHSAAHWFLFPACKNTSGTIGGRGGVALDRARSGDVVEDSRAAVRRGPVPDEYLKVRAGIDAEGDVSWLEGSCLIKASPYNIRVV